MFALFAVIFFGMATLLDLADLGGDFITTFVRAGLFFLALHFMWATPLHFPWNRQP